MCSQPWFNVCYLSRYKHSEDKKNHLEAFSPFFLQQRPQFGYCLCLYILHLPDCVKILASGVDNLTKSESGGGWSSKKGILPGSPHQLLLSTWPPHSLHHGTHSKASQPNSNKEECLLIFLEVSLCPCLDCRHVSSLSPFFPSSIPVVALDSPPTKNEVSQ